jgi:hypothetical protein
MSIAIFKNIKRSGGGVSQDALMNHAQAGLEHSGNTCRYEDPSVDAGAA